MTPALTAIARAGWEAFQEAHRQSVRAVSPRARFTEVRWEDLDPHVHDQWIETARAMLNAIPGVVESGGEDIRVASGLAIEDARWSSASIWRAMLASLIGQPLPSGESN